MTPVEYFLGGATFAVAGASQHPHKYGNKVFRALLTAERETYPINPNASQVEGHPAYARLSELPTAPESLSIVTPPEITHRIVQQAIELGVKNIWMQPGAENPEASNLAREAGIRVIDDGACLLVALALE